MAPRTKPAPPPRPIVQMTQQQQTKRAGKPVLFRSTSETVVTTDRGIRLHLVGTAEDGALWERWSGDAPGAWHEIERPQK